ncbi:MAG: diguanylate cyclase [Candidatus Marinimicrobia bacterium]|nr:diguanylate cyclase [Candidatus Neomarinimicrobiota bacterium]
MKPAPTNPPPGPDHAEILFRAVEQSPSAVLITDAAGTVEYVNEQFCRMTGYPRAEALGRKISLLKSGEMPASFYAEIWRALQAGQDWSGVFHNRRKSGETYWEYATISPVRDAGGRLRHYLKIAEDITERKRLEQELVTSYAKVRAQAEALRASQRKLRHVAGRDALTGLLNRRGFAAAFRQTATLAERQAGVMGLLVIDLDNFKFINDRYGHVAGDYALKACARLFLKELRQSDIVCRYGGDEFLVALPLSPMAETSRAAERLLNAVRRRRFRFEQIRLPLTISIGAACSAPGAPLALEPLLREADHALYRAKQSGRNRVSLSSGESTGMPQPAVPLESCGTVALEALVAMLDAREKATGEHSQRVARLAGVLARAMGLPAEQVAMICQGALLHDIGKIAVPDAVLLKPEPLTDIERAIMAQHPDIGFQILRSTPELAPAAEIVLSHQERFDGSGYPRGLQGPEICLGARIFAVVDAYDAIRAGRPYAPSRPAAAALREIQSCAGTQFDPEVAAALARCQAEMETVGQYPPGSKSQPATPLQLL